MLGFYKELWLPGAATSARRSDDPRPRFIITTLIIKKNMFIPEFMNLSNITSIKKKQSSKQDMDGQRGIFSLTIFKKILDNLLKNDTGV